MDIVVFEWQRWAYPRQPHGKARRLFGSLGVLVLKEDYFLSKPDGWIESLMGEWVYPVVKEVLDEEDMYSDKPPKNIPLHRSERNYRIEVFRINDIAMVYFG